VCLTLDAHALKFQSPRSLSLSLSRNTWQFFETTKRSRSSVTPDTAAPSPLAILDPGPGARRCLIPDLGARWCLIPDVTGGPLQDSSFLDYAAVITHLRPSTPPSACLTPTPTLDTAAS
jgi:hypothetical protein